MDTLAQAQELWSGAVTARQDGDLDRALQLDLEAVALFEASGDAFWLARGCTSVAVDHALCGTPHAAEEWGLRAVEAADESGDPVLRVMARSNLALDLCELSRPDDALPHLREALRLARDYGHQPLVYRQEHSLGYGLAQAGLWDDAEREFESSADKQRAKPEVAGELGATLMELAGCYMEQGRREDAIRVLEEACRDFTDARDEASAEGCRKRLAEVLAIEDPPDNL